jgi:hypothetical protein
MTNNHSELCGVETQLRKLIYEYNMATREGTLKQMANRLKAIGDLATKAEWVCNGLIFPPPAPKVPEEEVE